MRLALTSLMFLIMGATTPVLADDCVCAKGKTACHHNGKECKGHKGCECTCPCKDGKECTHHKCEHGKEEKK